MNHTHAEAIAFGGVEQYMNAQESNKGTSILNFLVLFITINSVSIFIGIDLNLMCG